MTALITIIHLLVCLVLIISVLLQSGKAADLAGAFGGGGTQTAFGPRSTANILSKVTTIAAILFMVTSLSLWILSGSEGKSAVSGEAAVPAKAAAAQTETKTDATPPATQPAGKPEEKSAPAKTPPVGDKQPAPKTESKPPSPPVKK